VGDELMHLVSVLVNLVARKSCFECIIFSVSLQRVAAMVILKYCFAIVFVPINNIGDNSARGLCIVIVGGFKVREYRKVLIFLYL